MQRKARETPREDLRAVRQATLAAKGEDVSEPMREARGLNAVHQHGVPPSQAECVRASSSKRLARDGL